MELLLIFSAMLSALTGAFTGTRQPETRLQQAEAAVAVEAAVVVVQAQAPSVAAAPSAARPHGREISLPPDLTVAVVAPLAFVRLIE